MVKPDLSVAMYLTKSTKTGLPRRVVGAIEKKVSHLDLTVSLSVVWRRDNLFSSIMFAISVSIHSVSDVSSGPDWSC